MESGASSDSGADPWPGKLRATWCWPTGFFSVEGGEAGRGSWAGDGVGATCAGEFANGDPVLSDVFRR